MERSRLQLFPISYFSVILGLSGFTIALQKVEHIVESGWHISNYVAIFTMVLFAFFLFVYIIKSIRYYEQVQEEFHHPIKLSFFPTISISLLLFNIILFENFPFLSKVLWIIGTFLHFIATIVVMSIWIRGQKFHIHHINPSWFIPIVGNIIVPVTGAQHFNPEVSWFFFSVGLLFWILLFAIFLYRIIFHDPLPQRLLPTLFILIAPPAVAVISYIKLTGELDSFTKVMYYSAFFLLLFLITQIRMFQKIVFFLSWWAYTFPIAAMILASVIMFHKTNNLFYEITAFVLLALLGIIVVGLMVRTIIAIKRREICVEED